MNEETDRLSKNHKLIFLFDYCNNLPIFTLLK